MPDHEPMSLCELIEVVDTPEGRTRLKTFLDSEPFPHFEAHPTVEGALIRIEADGTETAGKFVDRKFVTLESD